MEDGKTLRQILEEIVEDPVREALEMRGISSSKRAPLAKRGGFNEQKRGRILLSSEFFEPLRRRTNPD